MGGKLPTFEPAERRKYPKTAAEAARHVGMAAKTVEEWLRNGSVSRTKGGRISTKALQVECERRRTAWAKARVNTSEQATRLAYSADDFLMKIDGMRFEQAMKLLLSQPVPKESDD